MYSPESFDFIRLPPSGDSGTIAIIDAVDDPNVESD
jgi:hypothetical protein